MADYREVSQAYAKGAILALMTVNGGAAVALLSQVADLHSAGISRLVATPMKLWAAGLTCALLMWVLTFLSVRYVDKSERGPTAMHVLRFLAISDRLMLGTIGLFLISLALFVWGCLSLADSLSNL